METYQEKSDDPSNHYGGISRGAMNEIKDCIDALLAAVQNSEEYQEFEKYRDPLVNAFLDAELTLCKLMQKICRTLTEGIDLDIPEL